MCDSTINEAFEEFVFRRIEFLPTDHNAEYLKLSTTASDLMDAFYDKLDESLQEEYRRVEEAVNASDLVHLMMAYKRGLADGMQLSQLILQRSESTSQLVGLLQATQAI